MEKGLSSTTTHAFQFHGNAKEYFKIWIVNICLTIVTLGIYSAWAKVRNTQYFYGNAQVDNSPFQYLAKPMTILKGRLIAVAFFVLYSVLTQMFPAQQPIFVLLMLPLLPLVVVRSMRFKMRNTAYRNIRFNFTGKYGEAFVVFLLLPILIPFTLGIVYPYWQLRMKKFIINHTAYGDTFFELDMNSSPFYGVYFKVIIMIVILGIVLAGLGFVAPLAIAFIAPLLAFLFYSYVFALLNAHITNLIFNNSTLSEHSFNSELQVNKLYTLYLVNGVAIAFSLGLLIPWAQIRMAHYRAECTELNVVGDLDHFVAATQEKVSALGEEFGEVFDIEVGL